VNRLRALLYSIFLFQRGRAVALVILLALCGANWLSDTPSAHGAGMHPSRFVGIVSTPFAAIRQVLFDSYLRAFPRVREAQPVTVVTIDESSLKTIGQWPWPRDRVAELIDAIAKQHPAAIGLDVYMPEADQTSPNQVAANLPPGNDAVAQALKQLPSHDDRLAQSLRAAPTVLGVAGFDFETLTTKSGLRTVPVQTTGADPLPFVRRYPQVLASLPQLQAAAQGQGVESFDADESIVRRVPMVVAVGSQIVPSLAMEMLRVATGSASVEVSTSEHGIDKVSTADLTVLTQPQGDVWLHFAPRQQATERWLSAADVLAGKAPPDAIANKLILIGLTGSGLNDMRITALRELVPGVEIQAQILESLFDRRFLLRPWWMKGVEAALFLGLGLSIIWLVPKARARFTRHGGREPNGAGWLVLGANVLVFAAGYLVFWKWGLLFDCTGMLVGCAFLMTNLVFSSLLEIETENRDLAEEQQHLLEEAARISGELAAARRIQLASLPDGANAFPGERRFQLAATLEPARESGGDLYDFFLLNDHQLCFVIGDVSGKGMPAAVFMAMTKTLTKSLALRMAEGPAAVVAAANEDLSRDNGEMLFVTMLLGVLDLRTGGLQLVNAGHDMPWRLSACEAAIQIAALAQDCGPPLCVLDSYAYTTQHLQLQAGDRLCMVTDGVTEAMNAQGELYGSSRLQSALTSLRAEDSANAAVQQIRRNVAAFVQGAEPSDDLTILVLRWNGL
jgi:serine phosphatase RsbU (regulator of sigma subunit)/CHASE2 domain-containing sensor protein